MKIFRIISLLVLLAVSLSLFGTPAIETERHRNKKLVKTFLNLLEAEDIVGFSKLFAENGKQVNPYHSGLFPKEIVGRKQIYEFWKGVPGNFDGMKFPIEKIYPMKDPKMVMIKFKGIIKLKENKGFYKNDYLCLFFFDKEGKILEYHEYFNPLTAAKAFGLLNKIK